MYRPKWKWFSLGAVQGDLQLWDDILEHYQRGSRGLLSLKHSRFLINLIRVHWAAISACHPPIQGHTLFSHPTMSTFLKDLIHGFPPVRGFSLPGALQFDLQVLMDPLLSLEHCAPSYHLSIKTAFLAAATSALRVRDSGINGKTFLHKDTVILSPHPKFLPRVVSDFHLSQCVRLPGFSPKPHLTLGEARLHMLSALRTLSCYLHRTNPCTSHSHSS